MGIFSSIGKLKNPDISIVFSFHKAACRIDYLTSGKKYNLPERQIAAFLYYFSRYLVVCDNKQREPMKLIFSDLFRTADTHKIEVLTATAFQSVLETLPQEAQLAALRIFEFAPPVITLDSKSSDPLPDLKTTPAKYTFTCRFMPKKGLQTHLDLGVYDKILMPLSVLHLYYFVMHSLSTTEDKRALANCAAAILKRSDETRLSTTFIHNAPLSVLKSYHRLTKMLDLDSSWSRNNDN